jgi:O-antigen/teichoic acid export membrane protein
MFLSLFPWIVKNDPGSFLGKFYDPGIGVGYVFISNLLASFFTLILLFREILFIKLSFDKHLLKGMLIYSFPILVIGLAGMINQNIDKILIPFLIPQEQNPMFQLGIYGASYKLAVLMNMFIQAFRYAFEPFFFSKSASESKENPKMYANVMKYFIIFGLIIFLGMVLYIDIIKLLIPGQYHEGIKVVPIILMADLFFGVFFSASIWYKIKDRTKYGAYIALMGAVITLVLNILLIPAFGYMGSAVAVFVCYFFMMVINYFWGQKFYPIPYDLKRIAVYFVICLLLFSVSFFFASFPPWAKYLSNSILLIIFLLSIFKMEKSELMQLLGHKKRIK